MRKIQVNPVLRAVGVIGSVAVLVSGVTFAAMQNSATLTDNTIASATAGLLVDGSDEDTIATAGPEAGFTFTGLIPGGDFSTKGATKEFRLKNGGSAPLDVSVQASTITGNINKNLVTVRITNDSETGDPFTDYTLAQLEAGSNPLPGVSGEGSLDTASGGEQDIFDIQVKLGAGAVDGSGGSIDAFNLVFTGINHAEANPVTP